MEDQNPEAARRFQEGIFHWKSLEEVDRNKLLTFFHENHFACIRGLFSPDELRAARKQMRSNFDSTLDHGSKGEAPGAVMANFQKIAAGAYGHHWCYHPRLMRVIYNPLWEPNTWGLHDTFRRLAELRNIIQDHPRQYAVDQPEDGLWTAARVQHYPAGGGFMAQHRDAVLSTISQESADHYRFLQNLLLLTKKGEDYETGGGWFELDGEKFDYELHCELGDVVFYDDRVLHGVDDVDPERVLDLTTLSGRMVLMATLYVDMSEQDSLFEGYHDRDEVDCSEVRAPEQSGIAKTG